MYVQPGKSHASFNCPNCGAFAQQVWFEILAQHRSSPPGTTNVDIVRAKASAGRDEDALQLLEAINRGIAIVHGTGDGNGVTFKVQNAFGTRCAACRATAFWIGEELVYPSKEGEGGPEPNPDLPPDIQRDYREAQAVLEKSPRAAAALLRLSLQKLCEHLLSRSGDINEMIAELVQKGLPSGIQKALDVIRVIGNEAVHPGKLDLRDDRELVTQLFRIMNFIAERMITQEREIDEIFDNLPEGKREGIKLRDSRKP